METTMKRIVPIGNYRYLTELDRLNQIPDDQLIYHSLPSAWLQAHNLEDRDDEADTQQAQNVFIPWWWDDENMKESPKSIVMNPSLMLKVLGATS